MNPAWKAFKKSFDAWEQTTADTLEHVLRSPAALQPAGAVLSWVTKGKVWGDRFARVGVRSMGLATRLDQERTLHALNELHSRMYDIEEQLIALREELRR